MTGMIHSLIHDVARRAERKIGGIGPVPGIQKHKYAKNLVDGYQTRCGDRGLRTERSYFGRREVPYGTKGSARIDVYDTTTNGAYDYKFGRARLMRRQTQKIQTHGPRGISVQEVKP